MNGYGKRRRCTDERQIVVEFYCYLAAALIVIRHLINQARGRYRWPTRPPPAACADPQLAVAPRGVPRRVGNRGAPSAPGCSPSPSGSDRVKIGDSPRG